MPTTHRLSSHYLYRTWISMKERCYNEKNVRYIHYGGRGIKVCDEWINSFPNFLNDMGDRPDGMTLDRIDNNGDYKPSNCRWSTYSEQNTNRGIKRNNTHGYRHIYFYKRTSRWVVKIKRNGIERYYGYFSTKEEAINERNRQYNNLGITYNV